MSEKKWCLGEKIFLGSIFGLFSGAKWLLDLLVLGRLEKIGCLASIRRGGKNFTSEAFGRFRGFGAMLV